MAVTVAPLAMSVVARRAPRRNASTGIVACSLTPPDRVMASRTGIGAVPLPVLEQEVRRFIADSKKGTT